MGRNALTPEQRKINRIESVRRYQQTHSYKDYKRRYWLSKKETINIDISPRNKIIVHESTTMN